MEAIGSILLSLFEAGLRGFQVLLWLIGGLVNLCSVFSESINIFMEILSSFLPTAVSTTMIAVCGGLIVFRILGRS